MKPLALILALLATRVIADRLAWERACERSGAQAVSMWPWLPPPPQEIIVTVPMHLDEMP